MFAERQDLLVHGARQPEHADPLVTLRLALEGVDEDGELRAHVLASCLSASTSLLRSLVALGADRQCLLAIFCGQLTLKSLPPGILT